jgi:hypothetical protein
MSTEFINDQWRLPNEENKSKVSNYSMDFDTSSTHIEFATIQLNTTKSVSFWVNWNTTITGVMLGGGSGNYYPQIHQTSGVTRFYVRDTGGVDYYTYNSLLNTNQWYHVCITGNGTTAKVYLDGSLIGTMTDYTPPLKYINTENGSQYGMIGKLDAVCIFDYELSSSQITTLYGSSSTGIGNPMSLSPKPVAYYPLGDQDAFNGANYLVPNSSLKDYVFDFIPNDYIDIGNQNELKNITELSVSLWFNYDSIGSSADGLVARDSSSRVDGNWYVALDYNNSIRFLLKTANGQDALNSSTISPNKWYHTLCVWDGQNMKIYLNGSLDNSITLSNATGTLGNASDVVAIGRRFASGGFLNGKASNVQIFNTALPATGSNSVETLYNNGSPLTSMSGFTSLQGWWKLDASDTYDGTNWTIEDHAGSNDGTSSGMTQANLVQSDLSFTSGYSPYALDFDGTNDYIDCGDSDDFSFGDGSTDSPFSVSAWVNPDAVEYAGIVAKYVTGGWEWLLYLLDNNFLKFLLLNNNTSGNSIGLTTDVAIPINTWTHVSATYNANGEPNGIDLYINGSLQSLVTESTSGTYQAMTNTTAPLQIGTWNGNFRPINGQISNVSIWDVKLTPTQVSEIYNEGVPQNLLNHSAVSSLVSWWQLGSNSSFNTNWTVLDEKGSNNGNSANMGEDAIVDGVGSYANGLSSGMGGDEVIGDAPYSTANALSVNMDVEDRVTDTPS